MLDKIFIWFRVLAIIYILAVAFSGLSLLFSIAGQFLHTTHGFLISSANAAIALLAALALFVGNIILIKAKPTADKINEVGQRIGLSASTGQKFTIITWVAFGIMMIATASWTYEFCQIVKARKDSRRRATRVSNGRIWIYH
jgi:hypothetical protein